MAKKDTRQKILKAAEELFSKNGFDGVPTKVIASEAGITEMTLFNHFSSKELLYKTIVKESYLSIGFESVLSELSYEDLESDLKIISSILIKNFVSNRNQLMMRLKEKQSFQNDENFSIAKDPLLKQIKPVFKNYDEKGLIQGPYDKTALLFMATFKGLCHLCLLENKNEKSINALVHEYITTFCHGVMSKNG